MVGRPAGLNGTALDAGLPPGPYSVPAALLGGVRVTGSGAGGESAVTRLGLVSGWQLRHLLPGRAGMAARRTLPGRLVRAGVLAAYTVEAPVRLPPLYGAVSRWLPWDGPAAVNQVVANHFLVRLLPRGPVRGAAFWTSCGCGLQVTLAGGRYAVLSFREGRDEEERFRAFLDIYRPEEGKAVIVAASVGHLVRLSLLARARACPLRLTWDGALFHLPLARAFCRVGEDGPVPVVMSGLGDGNPEEYFTKDKGGLT